MQAGADSGGTFTDNGNGNYTYKFATVVPKTYDPAVTHTVGAYGSRNLTEFDMGTNYADTTFNFVPNGSKVTVVRDVIKSAVVQQLPRPDGLPRRFAPQHGTLQPVPHAADHRSGHREHLGYGGVHPQAAHRRQPARA